MQLSEHLALFLAFTAATVAWPFSSSTPAKRDENHVDDLYYLKTKVLNGGSQDYDGLYVQSYHTGAGLSDATLGTKDHAVAGFLNGTVQQFNLTTSFPWSFFLPQPTTYDAWYPVRLNAGTYSTEFFLNETGLQWTDQDSFGGWLVCDWSHGVPQLFWKVNYYDYKLPICAQVELYPEYVDDDDTDDEE